MHKGKMITRIYKQTFLHTLYRVDNLICSDRGAFSFEIVLKVFFLNETLFKLDIDSILMRIRVEFKVRIAYFIGIKSY